MYNQNDPADMNRYTADFIRGSGLGSSHPTAMGRVLNDLYAKIGALEKRVADLEAGAPVGE